MKQAVVQCMCNYGSVGNNDKIFYAYAAYKLKLFSGYHNYWTWN